MNKKLQIIKLTQALNKRQISPDLHDLMAMTDSNLSYEENYKNIMSRFGNVSAAARKSSRGTTLAGQGGNIDLKYARDFHQGRSLIARMQDEARTNRTTRTERQIAKNPDLLNAWFKNPGRSDIQGIDSLMFIGASRKRKRR